MKKLQIIETVDYVLAVSDEEPKMLEWFYDTLDHVSSIPIYQRNNKQKSYKGCVKIIAYQPKGNALELDLPLLPKIVVEDDVRKLALTLYKEPLNKEGEIRTQLVGHGSTPFGFNKWFKSFKTGYKSATKRFSEEDLIKAIELSRDYIPNTDGSPIFLYKENEIIQSLKKPKLPKWFVAEIKTVWNRNTDRNIPTKADLDEELKTTTINNKTYLVGHYEF
jgi:hypothetical protein